MYKYLFFLISLLSILLLGACQEDTIAPQTFGTISGEVVRSDDFAPIEQSSISSTPTTSSIITDASGRFELESVLIGTYTIRVEKEGFITKLEPVNVLADKVTSIVIRMTKDTLINTLPEPPFDPIPSEGSTDVLSDVRLEWTAMDADEGAELSYDVELFEEDQTTGVLVADDITDNFIDLENLKYNTNYFWQVTVKDGKGDPVFGSVWNFKTIDFPANRFLFVQEENGKFDIYSSDMEGNAIRLTNNSGSNWRPRMSPNRDQIAYISNIGIEPQIYIMNRDGTDPYQLTTISIAGVNNFELDFAWSPNGNQLLYMNNANLYKINKDGSGLTQIAETPSGLTFTECDWTAQGNKIVARTTGDALYKSQIFILDDSGVFESQIVLDELGSTKGGNFSINGSKLLYTHDISGFEAADGRQLNARIIQKDINSGLTIDLSFNKIDGTNDLDSRYSPDGSKIIFTNSNNDGISTKNIWIMDIDGSDRALLFENAEMADWR